MPRKGPAPKRPVIIDPVYSSPLVTSLVNKVLTDSGMSKSDAEDISSTYEESLLDGLRRALLAVAMFALASFWPARRLPGASTAVV